MASSRGIEFLLQKIQETDLENLRLLNKVQRFTVLEMTLRSLSETEPVCRKLLAIIE